MVLWVFGYGSLIWKPSFSYEERVVGYVKNYRRVFHQACIDFRGTQQTPGRTLTLEEQEGAVTWGVAYRVTASVEAQLVEAYLNQRERTYDVRALIDVYTAESPHTPAVYDALTYIATPSSANLWYLGPAPLHVMAEQIARSRGPAGENHEYLFRLEESLRQIGAACVDTEIVELANEVRKILHLDHEVPKILIRQALQNRQRDLDEMAGSNGDDPLRRRVCSVGDEDATTPMRMAWGQHYSGALQVIAS
ncbi:unnamed protein product [Calypogeia fissa]